MDLFLIRLHIRRAKQGITASSAWIRANILVSSTFLSLSNLVRLLIFLENNLNGYYTKNKKSLNYFLLLFSYARKKLKNRFIM
jgi:hypothetical protein